MGLFCDVKTCVFDIKICFFEEKSPRFFGPKFWRFFGLFWGRIWGQAWGKALDEFLDFLRARPFGARWAGPPLLFVERKYWKSSEEKVSRKTTLYFLGKMTFLVILLIKSLWDLSKTTDLVERIRMQFFLSKIDRRMLELWHFFFNLHFIWILPIFRSKIYLKRQISSRGSGCNFSCPKLIGER